MRRSSRRTGLGSIRSRSASGSIPSRSANSSIACSSPKAPGVLPGPRMAQPGPALMNTSCCAPSKLGQAYSASALIADAGAKADAGCAIAQQRNRRQRTVAVGADAQSLPGARTVAGIHLFFLPIEDEPHRRSGAAGQLDGDAAIIAERRLRAEAAAHGIDDHAHAIERQTERLRDFMAHAGGVLGRHVNGQPVGSPIGDDAMRLEAAMGLHLRCGIRPRR